MGVLTHYFKTKDDLIVFTFRWLAEDTFRQLDELIQSSDRGLASLAAAIESMFPKAGEPAALALWMSLWDRAVRNPVFAHEHRRYYRRWRRYVRQFLSDAIKLKQMPKRLDIDSTTDLVVATTDGLWLAMTLEPRRFPKPRQKILLQGLIRNLTQNGAP